MPQVSIATATATGAAHVRRRLGNEDAAGWAAVPRGAVLAVADGHSDPRCIRADRGARLAVRAALQLPDLLAADALSASWRRLVEQDEAADPLPPETEEPSLAYGTTAIVCRIDEEGLQLLQVGDGAAVLATAAGAVRLLPPDALEGTAVTESLASATTAGRLARLPLTDLPVLVCLSTDGVDAAYPDGAGLLRAAEQLRRLAVEEGPDALPEQLDRWVREAAGTSGDDATVAVAFVAEEAAR